MSGWASKIPSSAFCLLVRLFTLRCTEKQMTSMLSHPDSPYIRCMGLLYLRYAADPSLVWGRFEPILYDDEPVRISANPQKPESSVGQYARDILTDMNYYGTILPRLPVAIERDIKVKLLLAEKIEERAKAHLKGTGGRRPTLEFFEEGARVRALYGDEDHPVTWYDAVIDRVVRRDEETGEELVRPKYWVTFPEYGNTECVSLGEIDVREGDDGVARAHDRERGGGRVDGGRCDRGSRRSPPREYDVDSRGQSYRPHQERRHYGRERGRGYEAGPSSDRYTRDRDGGGRSRDCNYDRSRDRDRERSYESSNRRGDRDGYHRRERSRSRSRSWSRGRDPGGQGASVPREGSTNQELDLMEEVLRREREKSAAKGKAYAVRPATFKRSLALKHDDSRTNSSSGKKRSSSPIRGEDDRRKANGGDNAKTSAEQGAAPTSEKTPEERAAIEEKKRKLMAKYG